MAPSSLRSYLCGQPLLRTGARYRTPRRAAPPGPGRLGTGGPARERKDCCGKHAPPAAKSSSPRCVNPLPQAPDTSAQTSSGGQGGRGGHGEALPRAPSPGEDRLPLRGHTAPSLQSTYDGELRRTCAPKPDSGGQTLTAFSPHSIKHLINMYWINKQKKRNT